MVQETSDSPELVVGHAYEIRSRNLSVAAYAGPGAFIGIREKLGSRYLFTEWGGSGTGSVRAVLRDLGQIPAGIPLRDHLPPHCTACGRPVEFVWDGPGGSTGTNYHVEDGTALEPDGDPVLGHNQELFDFLDCLEAGFADD